LLLRLQLLVLVLLMWFSFRLLIIKEVRSHLLQVDVVDHVRGNVGVGVGLSIYIRLLFAVRDNCDGIGVQPTIHPAFLQLAVAQRVALDYIRNILERGLDTDLLQVLRGIFLLKDLQKVWVIQVDTLLSAISVPLWCSADGCGTLFPWDGCLGSTCVRSVSF